MTQEIATYAFGGGLDSNSSPLATPPGCVIASDGYEPLAEGYGRMLGYERYDGRAAPSQSTFWTLAIKHGRAAPEAGDTITGAGSGASALVIGQPVLSAGSWGDGDAFGIVIVTELSGAFIENEALSINGAQVAVSGGSAIADNAATIDDYKARRALAIEARRALVLPVPGSGPVRGVAVHDGQVYAWRDDVGGKFCLGYRATAAGWEALPILQRLAFISGHSEIAEGDVVIGATSGATGTVRRRVVPTGDWLTNDAAGHLDLSNVTGTFLNAETIKVGATASATAAGFTAVTLATGGRIRTRSHNFYGAANRYRLYGTVETGPAFEMLEGGYISTINTGMVPDRPQRLFILNNHLGLVYPGGSIQFSGILEPQAWEIVLGAGEIGFGSDVTDVVEANQTAVAVFGQNKIGVLQGTDKATFSLDVLTTEAGAIADTAQRIGNTVYLDARGLRDLQATQAYGNFKTGAISARFERYLRLQREAGIRPIGSFVCKSKGQYRLIWNDGTGLTVYLGGKTPQAMAFSLGNLRPHCFGAGELDDSEAIFAGAEDGYVYRLESGNTLDADPIGAFCTTPFNPFSNPVQEERFHKVAVELDAAPEATIGLAAEFDYGEGTSPDAGTEWFTARGSGGRWNEARWDEFYWSSPYAGRATFPIDGYGRNASLTFISNPHPTEGPHILQAYQVYRSPRRIIR